MFPVLTYSCSIVAAAGVARSNFHSDFLTVFSSNHITLPRLFFCTSLFIYLFALRLFWKLSLLSVAHSNQPSNNSNNTHTHEPIETEKENCTSKWGASELNLKQNKKQKTRKNDCILKKNENILSTKKRERLTRKCQEKIKYVRSCVSNIWHAYFFFFIRHRNFGMQHMSGSVVCTFAWTVDWHSTCMEQHQCV